MINEKINYDRLMMEEINKTGVNAPTNIGDVAISNVLNTGVDIIITKNIK